MHPLYSISVCGGLEKIAQNEIQRHLIGKGRFEVVDKDLARVRLRYSGDPRE